MTTSDAPTSQRKGIGIPTLSAAATGPSFVRHYDMKRPVVKGMILTSPQDGRMDLLTVKDGGDTLFVLQMHPDGRVVCSRCAEVVGTVTVGQVFNLSHMCVPVKPFTVESPKAYPGTVIRWSLTDGSLPRGVKA